MANVPLSAKLCTAITENATAPFKTIIQETTKTIATDPQLGRLVREHLTSTEEADMAEALWNKRKEWQLKYNMTLQLVHGNTVYGLDTNVQPFPGQSWHTVEVNSEIHPHIAARLEELLAPLKRAEADREALNAALDAIFNAVPTLNRAIETLPAIMDWIPDDARTKYYAANPKREKPKLDAAQLRQDTLDDAAIAAIARSRMK